MTDNRSFEVRLDCQHVVEVAGSVTPGVDDEWYCAKCRDFSRVVDVREADDSDRVAGLG